MTIQCPSPAKILNINIYYRLRYSNKTFESIRRLYAAKPVQILHERRFWGLETSIEGTGPFRNSISINSSPDSIGWRERRQQNRYSESQTARVPLLSYLMQLQISTGQSRRQFKCTKSKGERLRMLTHSRRVKEP